jgi:sec-independent protein translocase protein TatB
MFDIGWGELVVIGIVALIAIGPKELPTVLRTMGQWMGKVRRMASEFQGQFQEAMREAEFAELKKQVDQIGDTARDLPTSFDPLETARKEIEKAAEDKLPATESSAPAPVAGPIASADAPAAAAATEPQPSLPEPAPPAEPAFNPDQPPALPAAEKTFNPDQPTPPPASQAQGGRAA